MLPLVEASHLEKVFCRACCIIVSAMEGTTTAPALESCQHQHNRSTGAPAASSRLPWKGLPPLQLWRAASTSTTAQRARLLHHRASHGRDYHRASFEELPAPAQPLNGRACCIIASAMEGTTTAPALESCQHQHNRSTGAPAASSRLPWKERPRASFGELPAPAQPLNGRACCIIASAMEGTTTAPAPAQPLNGRACCIIASAMEGTTTRQLWKKRLLLSLSAGLYSQSLIPFP